MGSIQEMLTCKIWAVVGATDNKEKFGYKIFKFLRDAGFDVYAVNPGVAEILGQKCYAALQELPVKPDVVNVVVPPRVGEQVMKDCAELGIQNVWLQPGANGDAVVKKATELKLNVVNGACVMVEARAR